MPRKEKESELTKPKRPQTAFILFCNDERQRLTKEQPDLKFGDVGKQLGVLWRGINDKTKKKYHDKAEKEKKRYEEEVKEYIKRGGDKDDLKRKKKGETKEKGGKSGKKELKKVKDKNEPKRPQSAYLFFSKDARESLKTEQPGLTFGEIGRIVGEKWKDASSATKQKYQKMADEAKKKYDSELKNYRAKTPGSSGKETSAKGEKKAAPAASDEGSESEDDDDDDDDDEEEDE